MSNAWSRCSGGLLHSSLSEEILGCGMLEGCTCEHRWEVGCGYQGSFLPLLPCLLESLTEPGLFVIGLNWLTSKFCSAACCEFHQSWSYQCSALLIFNRDAGNPSSGLHTCSTRFLTVEPSSQKSTLGLSFDDDLALWLSSYVPQVLLSLQLFSCFRIQPLLLSSIGTTKLLVINGVQEDLLQCQTLCQKFVITYPFNCLTMALLPLSLLQESKARELHAGAYVAT